MNALLKKAVAEFVGVAAFLAAIISATSGTFKVDGFANVALATTLGLMILLTAGTSGGHLNPAVSLYFFAKKAINLNTLLTYVAAQLAGGIVGVALGQYLSSSVASASADASAVDLVSEVIATGVLVWIVGHLAATDQGSKIPAAVGLWVLAASLYTSTGAQANPAVTFGLLLAGKSIAFVAPVILAQVAGALLGLVLVTYVTGPIAKKAAKKSKK